MKHEKSAQYLIRQLIDQHSFQMQFYGDWWIAVTCTSFSFCCLTSPRAAVVLRDQLVVVFERNFMLAALVAVRFSLDFWLQARNAFLPNFLTPYSQHKELIAFSLSLEISPWMLSNQKKYFVVIENCHKYFCHSTHLINHQSGVAQKNGICWCHREREKKVTKQKCLPKHYRISRGGERFCARESRFSMTMSAHKKTVTVIVNFVVKNWQMICH